MGNATPLADLMVVSPASKRNFLIDVKGLYKRNPWVIKETNEGRAVLYSSFCPRRHEQSVFHFEPRAGEHVHPGRTHAARPT
jgi:hypothetical protein